MAKPKKTTVEGAEDATLQLEESVTPETSVEVTPPAVVKEVKEDKPKKKKLIIT